MQLAPTTRLIGIDVARALAIAGMMWVHTSAGDGSNVLEELPSGNSSLLFALIAGISLGFVTKRDLPPAEQKLRLVGRAVGLFLVAFALSWLATPIAVIIGYYGLWFLLAPLFIGWSNRTLLLAAGVLAVLGPVLSIVIPWAFTLFGGYSEGGPNDLLMTSLFSGMYPGVMYLVPVLVGLVLFRTGFAARWWLAGCAAAILGFGGGWALQKAFDVPAGGASSSMSSLPSSSYDKIGSLPGSSSSSSLAWEDRPIAEELTALEESHRLEMQQLRELAQQPGIETAGELWDAYYGADSSLALEDPAAGADLVSQLSELLATEGHSNSPFALIGGVGLGIMVVMLCLWLCQVGVIATILRPVVAMGAMPLTAYCLHVVLVAFFEETMSFMVLTPIVLVACFLCSFLSRRGPLEWVMGKMALLYTR